MSITKRWLNSQAEELKRSRQLVVAVSRLVNHNGFKGESLEAINRHLAQILGRLNSAVDSHDEAAAVLASHNRRIDMTGKVYGNLTAIEYVEQRGCLSYWRFICTCGRERIARGYRARKGEIRACIECSMRECKQASGLTRKLQIKDYLTHWKHYRDRFTPDQRAAYNALLNRKRPYMTITSAIKAEAVEAVMTDWVAAQRAVRSAGRNGPNKHHDSKHCLNPLRLLEGARAASAA